MPKGDNTKKVSAELKSQIIQLYKQGKTVSQIAEIIDVKIDTIADWKLTDPAFLSECTQAQTIGFEAQADSLLTIPDECTDVNVARLKSDNLKWLLARRAREQYGDKLDVTLNQTVNIKDALSEAKNRVREVIEVAHPQLTQPIDNTQQSNESSSGSKPVDENDPDEKASEDIDIFK